MYYFIILFSFFNSLPYFILPVRRKIFRKERVNLNSDVNRCWKGRCTWTKGWRMMCPSTYCQAGRSFPVDPATFPDTSNLTRRWAVEGQGCHFCEEFMDPPKAEAASAHSVGSRATPRGSCRDGKRGQLSRGGGAASGGGGGGSWDRKSVV